MTRNVMPPGQVKEHIKALKNRAGENGHAFDNFTYATSEGDVMGQCVWCNASVFTLSMWDNSTESVKVHLHGLALTHPCIVNV